MLEVVGTNQGQMGGWVIQQDACCQASKDKSSGGEKRMQR